MTETEIIRLLTSQFAREKGIPLGFDDDLSALPLSSRQWIIVKTDMLVGSTDIPPGMTIRQAARKAVVSTISDFAAKGVRPKALMVSLGLPSPAGKSLVQDIARGLKGAAREYHCKIIGGDTNQADDFVMDVVGIGITSARRIVRRDGARPGDVVAVTGPFGKSSAGLRILMSRRGTDVEKYPSLVRAVLHPRARLDEGVSLARSRGATSSIDSSDGLAWSLHQIAQASRVGISLERIPIAAEVDAFSRERRLSALNLALYGGEEYELIVTLKPQRFAEMKKRVPSLLRIGNVARKHVGVVGRFEGRQIKVEPRGWEHLR